ncbi:MAG: hypothetical protein EOP86_15875 [Verrucomicrobiaceae bacterium]|nr:MAG: hypothetical protein EOP86_15875 [Verrucomicrobiaceae bacterium]
MNFLEYQRMVIAYHGCDQSVVDNVLAGGELKQSENDYDWLGTGIYFWEQGPGRASDWAVFMRKRGRVGKPAVLGAVIQLGNCLDLLDVTMTRRLQEIYPRFEEGLRKDGGDIPNNQPARKMHNLDCAFLNWAIPILEAADRVSYHTIRGVFVEGVPLYSSSQLYTESHIQLAVRNSSAIVGYFLPAKP